MLIIHVFWQIEDKIAFFIQHNIILFYFVLWNCFYDQLTKSGDIYLSRNFVETFVRRIGYKPKNEWNIKTFCTGNISGFVLFFFTLSGIPQVWVQPLAPLKHAWNPACFPFTWGSHGDTEA